MANMHAHPHWMASAAADLASIASTMRGANAAAAPTTAGVLPAGGDQVSASIAAMFDKHAKSYQAIGQYAAEFHDRFVQTLQTSAGSYASTEANNVAPMQHAFGLINAATQSPTGSALLEHGSNALAAAGQHDGATSSNAVVGAAGSSGGWGSGGASGSGAHSGNAMPAAASHGDAGGGAMPSAASANSGGGGGGGNPSAGGLGNSAGGANVVSNGDGGSQGGAGWTATPTAPGAAAVAAGTPAPHASAAGSSGSSAAAMLGNGGWAGTSLASGALAAPAAPMASAGVAGPAAVQPDVAMAARAQAVYTGIPTHAPDATQAGDPLRQGNSVDLDRDKSTQLIPVPLPRLRGLRKKLQGLRERGEDREEEIGFYPQPVEGKTVRPPTPEDLLRALGLRPPGVE